MPSLILKKQLLKKKLYYNSSRTFMETWVNASNDGDKLQALQEFNNKWMIKKKLLSLKCLKDFLRTVELLRSDKLLRNSEWIERSLTSKETSLRDYSFLKLVSLSLLSRRFRHYQKEKMANFMLKPIDLKKDLLDLLTEPWNVLSLLINLTSNKDKLSRRDQSFN